MGSCILTTLVAPLVELILNRILKFAERITSIDLYFETSTSSAFGGYFHFAYSRLVDDYAQVIRRFLPRGISIYLILVP